MAIISTFKFVPNEILGKIGFLPTWIPGADATHYVAHDILEHFPDPQLPGLEGELLALGAALALRIENGILGSWHSREKQMANNMGDVLEWAYDNALAVKPLATRRMSWHFNYVEDIIQAGAVQAVKRVSQYAEDLPQPEEELLVNLVSWVRCGYRMALKRYDGLNLHRIGGEFFKAINVHAECIAKEYQKVIPIGDEVTFVVSPRRMTVHASWNGHRLLDY